MASPNPTAPPPVYGFDKKEEAYQNSTPQTAPVYNTQPQNMVNTYRTAPVIPVFGRNPQNHQCQYCGCNIVTEVTYEMGSGSWLICLGAFLVTGCCCCIPCCFDDLKDAVHTCPNCKRMVGRKNMLN